VVLIRHLALTRRRSGLMVSIGQEQVVFLNGLGVELRNRREHRPFRTKWKKSPEVLLKSGREAPWGLVVQVISAL